MVPPWGWEEVASYRARRDWAMRLAAAGHPTLRVSLPATGNSAGAPTDPDLVQTWIRAVRVAAARLSELCGDRPVVALGLGLGGLLVLAAAGGSPIEAAALWGIPRDGRAFVRETRAVSRLEQLPDNGKGVPEGFLEAGGFVLSSETIAALRDLTAEVAEGSPRRVLLFGRGSTPPPDEVQQSLSAAKVDVSVDDGPGWQQFVETPESAELPRQVASRFEAWLREDEVDAVPTGELQLPKPGAAKARIRVQGEEIEEQAQFLEAEWGRAFVVTSMPSGRPAAKRAAVFLNAGAVNTAGPNRMWVEIARGAAAAGIPAARVDLQGVGEADGEAAGVLRGPAFNQSRYGVQVREILRQLPPLIGADEFVAVGLCAGAHNAFRAAVDSRIVEVIMINGSAIRWHDELPARREAPDLSRALRRGRLRKVLRGEIPPSRLIPLFRSLLAKAIRRAMDVLRSVSSGGAPTLEQQVEADLDRASRAGTRLHMAFSGDEPLHTELVRSGIAAKIAATDGFAIAELPGNDHTLRPASSQAVLREMVLDQLKARAAEATTSIDESLPVRSGSARR